MPSTRRAIHGPGILVVDCHPPTAKLLEALEATGGRVRFATSAEEALDWIAIDKPAFALIDLIQPQMSGLLLAHRLKTRAETRDIVLIAMTDFEASATERLARSAGFIAFLKKPLDPTTFCAIVQAAGAHDD